MLLALGFLVSHIVRVEVEPAVSDPARVFLLSCMSMRVVSLALGRTRLIWTYSPLLVRLSCRHRTSVSGSFREPYWFLKLRRPRSTLAFTIFRLRPLLWPYRKVNAQQ